MSRGSPGLWRRAACFRNAIAAAGGHEVDFLATAYDGSQRLVQLASDITEAATFDRELRALAGAAEGFPEAERILLAETDMPAGFQLVPVWRWLLESAPSSS